MMKPRNVAQAMQWLEGFGPWSCRANSDGEIILKPLGSKPSMRQLPKIVSAVLACIDMRYRMDDCASAQANLAEILAKTLLDLAPKHEARYKPK